jgi:hypothetical protein
VLGTLVECLCFLQSCCFLLVDIVVSSSSCTVITFSYNLYLRVIVVESC